MTILGRGPLGPRPRVSVVVATRNREDYLADLLDSLAEQRFRDFEVVIVDDSDDLDSREAVLRLAREASEALRIKLVRNPTRLGIPRSLNRGVLAADGEIIAFTDDDCIADRSWLVNLLRWYRDPRVGGVGGRVVPVEHDALWIPEERSYPHLVGRLVWNGDVASNFDLDVGPLLVDCLAGANMSFRRELLLRVKGFSPLYAGNAYRFETDLAIRVKRLGYRIVFDPEAVIYHRRAASGGARVNAYEWNYWFCRNHALFLLRCVDHGLPKLALFAARQVARILRHRRACPYASPEKWQDVLTSCAKGLVRGVIEGLRCAANGEEGGIEKEKAITVIVPRGRAKPLKLTITVRHRLSSLTRSRF